MADGVGSFNFGFNSKSKGSASKSAFSALKGKGGKGKNYERSSANRQLEKIQQGQYLKNPRNSLNNSSTLLV